MRYFSLLGVLLLSASPAYSLDYSKEINKMCSPNETTQNACGFMSFGSAMAVVCRLKSRGFISEAGIELVKETLFTDDAVNQPGFIQAMDEWTKLGCSL